MFPRCLTILALTLGLVFPKAGWVVAHWAFGAQTVVICTGHDLITITLDADGNPVETKDAAHQACTLGKADASLPPTPLAAPADRPEPVQHATLQSSQHGRSSSNAHLPRAPPRL